MLVDVTAVLTSSALNAVDEAFSVPASTSRTVAVASAAPTAEQAAWAALLDTVATPHQSGPQQSGPDEGQNPQASRSLAALDRLASLSPTQLAAWAADPAEVAAILDSPPAASTVADWWGATDPAARLRMISSAPQLVGNLEGIPYSIRDAANRDTLSAAVADVSARISDGSAGRAALEQLRAQLHMLQQVQAAVAPGDSGLRRTLINLDVSGGGRAVIAVGDLATADFVTYLVPGMFYSVDNEIGSWAGAADRLAVDQAAWLERLTPAQHGANAQTVATVAWIGYQTPTVVDVASLQLAREGSAALTASVRGLAATRGDRPAPYLTVLAHSYGATATLLALEENDITVDALAMVGSPGSPAENVGRLKVRDGNVWVADAVLDPVSSTGVFGSQPLSSAYGAHHFGVQGAVDPITGEHLAGSVGHVDYFTAGSESFRNMALIGIGRGAYVLDPDGRASAAARAVGSAAVAWR